MTATAEKWLITAGSQIVSLAATGSMWPALVRPGMRLDMTLEITRSLLPTAQPTRMTVLAEFGTEVELGDYP